MSQIKILALLQSILSNATPLELGVLEDVVAQRLITAGLTVSASGVIATTVAMAITVDPVNLSSAVAVSKGGTGAVTLTNHGVLLGQTTSAVVVTAAGATGTVLRGVTGADPAFGAVALTTDVTGTLPVTNGGTGVATFTTAFGVVAAGTTATGALQTIAPSTAGFVLTDNGVGVLPSFKEAAGGLDYVQMQSFG